MMQPIPRVTVTELLARAVPYDRWRAPFDPNLAELTLASGLIILGCFLPLTGALIAGVFARLSLYPWLNIVTVWTVFTPQQKALIGLDLVDAAALVAFALLVAKTSWLRQGRPVYHWLAWAESVLGGLHAFVLALAIAAVVIVVVIGAAAAVLAIIALISGGSSSS